MKLLITGLPRSGKSFLLERVIAEIPQKRGFVTREVREGGERTGFDIITHAGHRQPLATIHQQTPYAVPRSVGGAYYVQLPEFERLLDGFFQFGSDELLYIDEIGKMELYSEKFRRLVTEYLASPNDLIATIAMRGDGFVESVKSRPDVLLLEVTQENRGRLYEELRTSLRRHIPRNT